MLVGGLDSRIVNNRFLIWPNIHRTHRSSHNSLRSLQVRYILDCQQSLLFKFRSVNNYFNSIAYLFPGSFVSVWDPESNYGLEMYAYSPLDNFIRTDGPSTVIGGE